MAIRVTKEKKTHQQYSDRYASALERIESCASTLLDLVDADAEAYRRVLAAYKLPKDSPEREKAIQEAIIGATEIPARTAHCATEALKLLEDLKAVIHVNVASDLGVGLQMLRSALSGAILNMRTNVAGIKNAEIRSRYEDMIARWEASRT